MWVHGGGFLGGSKEELSSYFKLLASHGYTVVAPRYSLAPEHHYPTPTRQVMQALEYLQGNAERLQLDPDRVVIGGDSAGAQIAAQIGALVTTPGYADAVGIAPTITPTQLRGLVLACGQYTSSCQVTSARRRAASTSTPCFGRTRESATSSTILPSRHCR